MGGWTKTKLMLNSTQVEVKVEVGVELGNSFCNLREGVKNIQMGWVPRFYGGYKKYSVFFWGGEDQTIFKNFKGGCRHFQKGAYSMWKWSQVTH